MVNDKYRSTKFYLPKLSCLKLMNSSEFELFEILIGLILNDLIVYKPSYIFHSDHALVIFFIYSSTCIILYSHNRMII
jgi:hypothetical protein